MRVDSRCLVDSMRNNTSMLLSESDDFSKGTLYLSRFSYEVGETVPIDCPPVPYNDPRSCEPYMGIGMLMRARHLLEGPSLPVDVA